MNLTFLSSTGAAGGTEVVLLECLRVLGPERPNWRLALVTPAEGALASRARALGVDPIVLPFPRHVEALGEAGRGAGALTGLPLAGAAIAVLPYAHRLRRALGTLHPDVVHAHGFKMQLLAALTRPAGSAVIWHIHDYLSPRPVTARLLRRVRRRCAAVIANSESVASDAGATLQPGPPVTVLHNTLDLGRFRPEGPAADLDRLSALPPSPPGTIKVGLVATLARWKGHETFLRALSRLPSDLPIRAYVVGGPLYVTAGSQHTLEELRASAGRLGLDGRVGFTGFVDDAPAALRALDVVVHASTAPEPFGMVIAEAMATARAVIMSEAGGALEIVRPGIDVLGHAPGDVAGLAEAIERLARDGILRERLGRAARESAERQFDSRRLTQGLEAVYSGACARVRR